MSAPSTAEGPAHPLRCPKPHNHKSRVHYRGQGPTMPQRVRRAHAQNVGDRGRSRSRRRRGCTAPNPQSCTDDSAAIVREIPGTAALAVDANHVGFARSAGVTHIFCAATVSPTPGSPPQMATPSSRRVGSPPNCATPIGRAGSGRHGRRRRLGGYSSAVRVRARSDDHAAPAPPHPRREPVFRRHRLPGRWRLCARDVGRGCTTCAASQADAEPIAWATDLAFTTSARRQARAPSGFSSYLSSLESSVQAGLC